MLVKSPTGCQSGAYRSSRRIPAPYPCWVIRPSEHVDRPGGQQRQHRQRNQRLQHHQELGPARERRRIGGRKGGTGVEGDEQVIDKARTPVLLAHLFLEFLIHHHLRKQERAIFMYAAFIALIERCYDAILAEGLAFHEAQPALISTARKRRGRVPRRTGHNLLLRLLVRKGDVLRFLSDPTVPFTNNLAERDGRMMKLRQKISGGFRSVDGAEDFAVIRSLLSTARKQGGDILQALASRPDRLIAELQIA